jgi:hypothetical protein
MIIKRRFVRPELAVDELRIEPAFGEEFLNALLDNLPLSRTRMTSALRTVLSRCAMTTRVTQVCQVLMDLLFVIVSSRWWPRRAGESRDH